MKPITKKTPLMLSVEVRFGKSIEEILRYLYVDKNNSITEISKTLDISYVTIVEWLYMAGIYHRKVDIYEDN